MNNESTNLAKRLNKLPQRSLNMQMHILREHLAAPQSRRDILLTFCQGKRVLDIGCVQHDAAQSTHENWLHGLIVGMASYVLGVDYLPEAVRDLREKGYNVIVGDVNKPLPIDDKFDVIIVGNLIEHLSNFEGLLLNIQKLLAKDGVALISTANPFFKEQYFYSALKNSIIVNQEHTCWIDPVTLDQLCVRFGLVTSEVRWVRERWKLSDAIFHGDRQVLDNFTGRWNFLKKPGRFERHFGVPVSRVLLALLPERRRVRILGDYGTDAYRYLYLKFLAIVVDVWWSIRQIAIPSSKINEYELFVSVIRRVESAE